MRFGARREARVEPPAVGPRRTPRRHTHTTRATRARCGRHARQPHQLGARVGRTALGIAVTHAEARVCSRRRSSSSSSGAGGGDDLVQAPSPPAARMRRRTQRLGQRHGTRRREARTGLATARLVHARAVVSEPAAPVRLASLLSPRDVRPAPLAAAPERGLAHHRLPRVGAEALERKRHREPLGTAARRRPLWHVPQRRLSGRRRAAGLGSERLGVRTARQRRKDAHVGAVAKIEQEERVHLRRQLHRVGEDKLELVEARECALGDVDTGGSCNLASVDRDDEQVGTCAPPPSSRPVPDRVAVGLQHVGGSRARRRLSRSEKRVDEGIGVRVLPRWLLAARQPRPGASLVAGEVLQRPGSRAGAERGSDGHRACRMHEFAKSGQTPTKSIILGNQ